MARRSTVAVTVLGAVGALLLRRRHGRPVRSPVAVPGAGGASPAAAPPEADEADLLDQRPVDAAVPADDARSHDPEAPEVDALEQAQHADGEVVAHGLPPDDAVPRADAVEQASVVRDD